MYGPYVRKDGRKHVVIVYPDGSKTTKSWPRVIIERHLGRKLTDEETVDHIDEDFTNDNIENLQILTRSDNAKKHTRIFPAEMIQLQCKYCGDLFTRRLKRYTYDTQVRKVDGPFCSKRCTGKVHH